MVNPRKPSRNCKLRYNWIPNIRTRGRSCAIFSRESNSDPSRAWMRVCVGFLQTLDRHVRINLGSGKARVTEQRLDAAQVRAAIEQVGGKTVTQFMWTDRDRNRRVPQISFQDQPDRARRNSLSRFVDEERPGMNVRGQPIFL